jgi:hypothetical protein
MSVTLGPVNERSTARYTTDPLTDEDGAVVAGSILSSATLTLYDERTGKILNSRNQQNVNNGNGVSIGDDGIVSWLLVPDDNAIINTRLSQERHVAVFDFRWDAGTSRAVHEVKILVNNIGKVTS